MFRDEIELKTRYHSAKRVNASQPYNSSPSRLHVVPFKKHGITVKYSSYETFLLFGGRLSFLFFFSLGLSLVGTGEGRLMCFKDTIYLSVTCVIQQNNILLLPHD